ncbi:MAG: site-specific DNA-methyltransferase [Deltaproteobacteria bacterium]|nr:site-specific DNA-methyltransferase [Deltaproteobacteria bacterium]
MSTLYYGDNLALLRQHVADESVDLVYLDPPFSTHKSYAALFQRVAAAGAPVQVHAFEDSWPWGPEAEQAYAQLDRAGDHVTPALRALRGLLGESDMMAYLTMMAGRLIELRRVLKPTGSIYLHCDATASHYLKILMDAAFGAACFRNEIVWRYRRWPARARQFQRMHDVLLFYSKSAGGEHTFHALYGYECLADSTLRSFGTSRQRADFSCGRRRPATLPEPSPGPPLSDVWEIGVLAPISRERLGYPTQKPEALLERIVRASSNEGDVVLDPVCGSGTTLAVAQRLGRRWIGMDSSQLAVALTKHRLATAFGDDVRYRVVGEPASLGQAKELVRRGPLELRWWVLGVLGARPAEPGRRAVPGVDGWLGLEAGAGRKGRRVAVAIREHVPDPAEVAVLRALMKEEGIAVGAFVLLGEPTGELREAAAAAGRVRCGADRHARVQLLTMRELLRGERLDLPGRRPVAQPGPPPPDADDDAQATLPGLAGR